MYFAVSYQNRFCDYTSEVYFTTAEYAARFAEYMWSCGHNVYGVYQRGNA